MDWVFSRHFRSGYTHITKFMEKLGNLTSLPQILEMQPSPLLFMVITGQPASQPPPLHFTKTQDSDLILSSAVSLPAAPGASMALEHRYGVLVDKPPTLKAVFMNPPCLGFYILVQEEDGARGPLLPGQSLLSFSSFLRYTRGG